VTRGKLDGSDEDMNGVVTFRSVWGAKGTSEPRD
jgi:hypothetical protein